MTPTEANNLRDHINRLVAAEIAESWRGSMHPTDWPDIIEELRVVRLLVAATLVTLTKE